MELRLDEILADLDPDAAHILVLRHVHDYSDGEISKMLGHLEAPLLSDCFSRDELDRQFRGRIQTTFGIGTNLTNIEDVEAIWCLSPKIKRISHWKTDI